MKNNIQESIITGALIAFALLLLNPAHFWMPTMMTVAIVIILLVLFGILASFIVREKNTDEREGLHRTLAGRNAFLVGATVILIGIAVQGTMYKVDPWLVLALVAMIVVKIGTRLWSDRNL